MKDEKGEHMAIHTYIQILCKANICICMCGWSNHMLEGNSTIYSHSLLFKENRLYVMMCLCSSAYTYVILICSTQIGSQTN